MTLRTHLAKSEVPSKWSTFRARPDTVRKSTHRARPHLAVLTNTTVLEEHQMDNIDCKSQTGSALDNEKIQDYS
jgi:hypothetical protein